MAKHSKNEPIHQPSLFDMEKIAKAADPVEKLERPFCEPVLFLGTSAFTAAGWSGTFYPAGMKRADYLTYYASRFKVEIDSTYYGTPPALKVTVRDYLAAVLPGLANTPMHRLDQLTPAAWAAHNL